MLHALAPTKHPTCHVICGAHAEGVAHAFRTSRLTPLSLFAPQFMETRRSVNTERRATSTVLFGNESKGALEHSQEASQHAPIGT